MLWRDLAAIFEYSLCSATIAQWRLAQCLARWAGKMISLSAGLRMLVRGARLGENQRLGEASSPGSAHQGNPRHAALSAFSCAGQWGEKRASSSR